MFYEEQRTPLIGKILLGVTGGAGMCWGINFTARGIYFRTVIVSIHDRTILINEVYRKKQSTYQSSDIQKMITGKAYDHGNWSRAISIKFKNGDKYEFIGYDYLNFREMVEGFQHLGKVKEVYLM